MRRNPPPVQNLHPAQDLINTLNSIQITYRIQPHVLPPMDMFRLQSLSTRQMLHGFYIQCINIMMHRNITIPQAFTRVNEKYVEVLRTVERYYLTPNTIDPFKYPLE